MGRFLSIFLLFVFAGTVLLLGAPLVMGDLVGEFDRVIGNLVIFFGSFIITQLFYIMDILKKNTR
ncbi:hypothetical protein Q73_01355 [Bacillus coahuilensis m2-6]|uniref:hypothetical protein n=1 Tax=Bacillus coahuilensis TaxID=408580 RepID=UPI0007506270|nr:hypothetical protein [Bacillus coahuilensis]KUP09739.1 hypothetical protein Q73_01355 [Bacillus coahuilensis m2-6]